MFVGTVFSSQILLLADDVRFMSLGIVGCQFCATA